LEESELLVEHRAEAVRLDRGFWTVTTILGILSVAAIVFWYVFPLTKYLPAAIVTARQVDQLFRFMAATGSALYIYVLGYLLYFSIRYRWRPSDGPDAIGVQLHDNHKLEFWWTLLPVLFVILLSIISVRIWYQIMLEPANGMVVEAIGHQWYYSYRYPKIGGEVTGNMHLPLGVPVTLNLTSSDVIHSFWVPAMRLKNDMVPGLVTTIRITPSKVGRFPIICTQFCGVLHSEMNATVSQAGPGSGQGQWVVIEPKAQFDAWFAQMQQKNAHVSNALPAAPGQTVSFAGGDVAAGKALFAQKCSACHKIAPFDQRLVGPGLLGVMHDPSHPNLVDGKPATPENVADILQNGYTGSIGTMPNASTNGLSGKDIANLVAYLNSLK
jgi:cytochrome c oxidase subunit 2